MIMIMIMILGSRFFTSFLTSKALTGNLIPSTIHNDSDNDNDSDSKILSSYTDNDGISLSDVLRQNGLVGSDESVRQARISPEHVYVERERVCV